MELPYDANNRQLNAKFYRNLVGSSFNDYTYKLDTEYDYILAFAVAPSDDYPYAPTAEGGPSTPIAVVGGAEQGWTSLRTLKLEQAFYDSATRVKGAWIAITACVLLLGQ